MNTKVARPLPSNIYLFLPPPMVVFIWLVLGLEVNISLVLALPVPLIVRVKVVGLLGPGEIMAGKLLSIMLRLGIRTTPAKLNVPNAGGTIAMFALRTGAQMTPTLRRCVTDLGDKETPARLPTHRLLTLPLTTLTSLPPFPNPTLSVPWTPPILVTAPPLRGVTTRVLLL